MAIISKRPPTKGLYIIQPIPMNNRHVDRANENGNEVMPRTNTRLIWGLSSTEKLAGKIVRLSLI